MIDFKNGGFFKLKDNNEYASRVTDLLVAGEKVVGAFKALRDGVVFTNKRIIAVNVQGRRSGTRGWNLRRFTHQR